MKHARGETTQSLIDAAVLHGVHDHWPVTSDQSNAHRLSSSDWTLSLPHTRLHGKDRLWTRMHERHNLIYELIEKLVSITPPFFPFLPPPSHSLLVFLPEFLLKVGPP